MDKDHSVLNSFTIRFWAVFLLMILTVGSTVISLGSFEQRQLENSQIINIAGKQRALTQKVARLLLSEYSEMNHSRLRDAVGELLENQAFLTQRRASSLSESIYDVYLKGSNNLDSLIKTNAEDALNLYSSNLSNIELSQQLDKLDIQFLKLDEAVKQLDSTAQESTRRIILFSNIALGIAIILFSGIFVFVYRPMRQTIKDTLRTLVTERQSAVDMLDNCPDATVRIDEKNNITYFSKRAEMLWGMTSNDVLGKNVSILVPSEHKEQHDSYIEAHRKTDIDHIVGRSREIELKNKHNETRYCILHISKSPTEDGKKGYTAFVRDMTMQRQQQKALEEAKRTAVLKSKMATIGEVAAGIAHEVNNPLTIITAQIELTQFKMKKGPVDGNDIDSKFKEILDQVERIKQIIRGVKGISRIDDTPEAFVDYNMFKLCEQIIAYLRKNTPFGDVNIELKNSNEDCVAKVSTVGFQQIITNLVNNARDALQGSTNKIITISVSREDEHVIVRVSDNGPGIPLESKDKIFEPFHTSKAPGKGTGLGLALVRKIVENMGGSIVVNGEFIGGAEFIISLPVATATKTESQNSEPVTNA